MKNASYYNKYLKYLQAVLLLFFICFSTLLQAQKNYTLEVRTTDGENPSFKYKTFFRTIAERDKEINNLAQHYYNSGFLGFSTDSIVTDSLNKIVLINTGISYEWASMRIKDSDANILLQSRIRTDEFVGNPVSFDNIRTIMEKILKTLENNGFPFAEVSLINVLFNGNTLEADLNIAPKQFFTIDSLNIKGSAGIGMAYLQNYLGIRPGDAYNEQLIRNIDSKLAELRFLRLTKPTETVFYDSVCVINIYADKKNANNFDGILGVIPDRETGKIAFTGDVKIRLLNAFKEGETLELNWKQFDKTSNKIFLHFEYPYLFNTPLAIDYSFDMLKNDSTYMVLNHIAGLSYLYSSHDKLRFFGDFRKTYTLALPPSNSPNPYGNSEINLFGLGWIKTQLDNRQNPSEGWILNSTVAAGQKKTEQQAELSQQSITQKQNEYHLSLLSELYINPFGRHVVLFRTNNRYMSGNAFFENELYRLGGLKTLRGFDEESIRASLFTVMTLEYRFLMQDNAFINIFFDGAYYEKKTLINRLFDRPYGFGAGISFETGQGLFSINYAVGKQFDNPLLFKFAKIHFGLINTF